jgi:hypothetical protein
VDDACFLHHAEGFDDLGGEMTDEGEGEATELVLLEEFIEVHVEQLEH